MRKIHKHKLFGNTSCDRIGGIVLTNRTEMKQIKSIEHLIEEVKEEEETIVESIMVLIEKEVELQLERYPLTMISHFVCCLNPKMIEQLRGEVEQLSGKRIAKLHSINIQGIIVELYSFMKLENLKDGQIYIYPEFVSPNKSIN